MNILNKKEEQNAISRIQNQYFQVSEIHSDIISNNSQSNVELQQQVNSSKASCDMTRIVRNSNRFVSSRETNTEGLKSPHFQFSEIDSALSQNLNQLVGGVF